MSSLGSEPSAGPGGSRSPAPRVLWPRPRRGARLNPTLRSTRGCELIARLLAAWPEIPAERRDVFQTASDPQVAGSGLPAPRVV